MASSRQICLMSNSNDYASTAGLRNWLFINAAGFRIIISSIFPPKKNKMYNNNTNERHKRNKHLESHISRRSTTSRRRPRVTTSRRRGNSDSMHTQRVYVSVSGSVCVRSVRAELHEKITFTAPLTGGGPPGQRNSATTGTPAEMIMSLDSLVLNSPESHVMQGRSLACLTRALRRWAPL